MTDTEVALLVGSGLAILGVVASKLSARLGVPALLLFLAVGMLAGSDGPGGIEFDDPDLAQSLGVVALAYILFAGGLDTRWADIRPVLAPGAALATAGVCITACVAGATAVWALDVPLTTGLLVGAIVSSTDAAAVFAVLRTRAVSLRGSLRPLLELESGSNDPMAVFLTIGLLELVTEPTTAAVELVPLFVAQMAVGGIAGLTAGRVAAWVLNRIRLAYEGLYPVFTLAMVAFTYSVTALLDGSGFLAVYVAGLVLSRHRFIHRNSLVRFHDALAWVGQIAMFVVLGLLVFPSELPSVALEGLAVAAALIFVARPLAVFVTLWPFRVPWRERALVAWVGLRGAAPIILATFPLMEGAPHAGLIFDTVFFIVLTSVLVQGTTIPFAARWMEVTEPLAPRTSWPLEASSIGPGLADLHELTVAADAPAVGRSVVDLGLPTGTMIVLVQRDGSFAVPTGATVLQPADELLVLGPERGVAVLGRLVRPPRPDP